MGGKVMIAGWLGDYRWGVGWLHVAGRMMIGGW